MISLSLMVFFIIYGAVKEVRESTSSTGPDRDTSDLDSNIILDRTKCAQPTTPPIRRLKSNITLPGRWPDS